MKAGRAAAVREARGHPLPVRDCGYCGQLIRRNRVMIGWEAFRDVGASRIWCARSAYGSHVPKYITDIDHELNSARTIAKMKEKSGPPRTSRKETQS